MTIDLHTHSYRSDGTDAPGDLVRAAGRQGLSVVALTDHDTTAGWVEAEQAAIDVGIDLVLGIEMSCRLPDRAGSVHLLAYRPDPDYRPLADELTRIVAGRDDRTPRILERLAEHGVDLTLADVQAVSGKASAAGRPHIADALVARGVVADRDEAFARFLGPGGPAYVPRYATPLPDALRLVAEAGGATVVAHPWSDHRYGEIDEDALGRLADLGLAGIEVDHRDHGPEARRRLRAIAGDLGLVVTGSSDYHGTGKVDHELGCETTAPEEYDALMARCDEAAAWAGRPAPGIVTSR